MLDVFETDVFESDLTNKRKIYLTQVVEAVFKKEKRMNIRISSWDLAV